jgi:hypothetical protein
MTTERLDINDLINRGETVDHTQTEDFLELPEFPVIITSH